jgi:hypothetical protein
VEHATEAIADARKMKGNESFMVVQFFVIDNLCACWKSVFACVSMTAVVCGNCVLMEIIAKQARAAVVMSLVVA